MTTTFDQWYKSLDKAPAHQTCWDAGRQSAECDLTQFREFSKLAARVMNDADGVLETVDGEDAHENEKLLELRKALNELVYQAFTLNGVMSLKQLKGE